METKVKQLHTSANGTDKKSSSELVKRKQLKETPFEIVTIDNISFGAMGDYRITEEYNTIKEVEKELSKMTWNRIIQVVMILDEVKQRTNKNNKNDKK